MCPVLARPPPEPQKPQIRLRWPLSKPYMSFLTSCVIFMESQLLMSPLSMTRDDLITLPTLDGILSAPTLEQKSLCHLYWGPKKCTRSQS